MIAPVRSEAERTEALGRALEVRRERARLRADLRERRIRAVDVVRGSDGDPSWAALQVLWLLKAVPGFGEVRAERALHDIGISRTRRLQGLGERQRAELIALLADR